MAQSRQERELKAIREIIEECFFSDDEYADIDHLRSLVRGNVEYKMVTTNGRVVGFILYSIHPGHMEILRRGVSRSFRGRGLGVKLSKLMVRLATQVGKPVYTYIAKTNLPSLNSHIKAGFRITNIDADWVHIRFTP